MPVKPKRRTRKRVDPFKRGFWKRYWREALILLVVSSGLYTMSIPYEFVLDDQIVIIDNKFTKAGFDGIKDIFLTESFTGYFGEQKDLVAGSRYRPLSIAMFAAEYEFNGDNPRGYHIGNILLYSLLCLLVFRMAHLFVRRRKSKWHWLLAVPFLAALLFALHPVHTEAVANIKGRDEIIALILSLATAYASMRYVHKGSWFWLLVSAPLFMAGLLAKENTVTFLAVIPAAFWFFSRKNYKRWLIAMIPLVAATGCYLALRIHVIGYLFSDDVSQELMNNPFVEMSIGQKYATITYTLGLYLKLLIFPHPLTHDYYPYHIPIMNWSDPQVIGSALLYAGLTLLGVFGVLKRRFYGFCILLYLATISIVSNLVFPIGTFMNERFLFMPSLAFCLALPYYLNKGAGKFGWMRWAGLAVIGLYIVGFTVKSLTRIPAWENPTTLNAAGVVVSKNSCRANCFMGTALYKDGQDISGREERYQFMMDAEKYIDRSLEIYPTYASANQMKSGFIAEHYRYDNDLDKLLSGFETVLARKPTVPYIPIYCEYLNGRNRVDKGKLLDFYYRVSVDIMLSRHQRADLAYKYNGYALTLAPENARVNYAAGLIHQALGQPNRAQQYLNKAYSIDPSLRVN